MRNYDKGGMESTPPDQPLQSEFRESLDFLISLENIINMTHLNLLREQGIIDNITFDRFNYVFSRSKEIKDGFEFVQLDNIPMIQEYMETIKELKDKLLNQNITITSMDIIFLIRLIQQALLTIKLNNHKEVKFDPLKDEIFVTALLNYIQTASLIRSNGFGKSIAESLESIIAGDFEICKNLAIEDFL